MVVNHDVVSNVFRFVVALAFAPIVWNVGRRIRMPGARRAFLVGLVSIIASFGMTAVDQQLGQFVPWLRYVRHLAVAVGGFAFAWAAWKVRLQELRIAVGPS